MSAAEVHPAQAATTGIINSAAYSNGMRIGEVPIDDASDVLRKRDHFVWIGLFEPSEELLQRVQKQFGLHDLAIEDAHSAHQRPKLERYEDSLFVVLRTAHLAGSPHRLEFGETHIFVGANYVVSVRHGSLRSHVGVRAKCEASPRLMAYGPGFVLYALMDFVVDQYFPIVEGLEEEFEDLEEKIFGEACSSKTTREIYHLRRDLISLKRAITPLIEVCNRVMKFDIELIPEEIRPYFRDVYDHVMRINEMIDSLRELLSTALESNLALISEQHTVQTKRLAAWAAIIAVPTMIAGIYGMNFRDMPELSWQFGYPVTVGVMLAICTLLWTAFRRSGWL
jgi:magnesium transporter